MTIERSIGWADDTLNPIGGLCPPEYRCSYCYVPSFYDRFGWETEPHLKLEAFGKARRRKKPTRYFLCSTHDLFGPWIPRSWIVGILSEASKLGTHTFLILTKYPERTLDFTNSIPWNCWLGVTITKNEDLRRFWPLVFHRPRTKFISFEPLLGDIGDIHEDILHRVNWIIVGALSLPGGRTKQPEREWVESLLRQADQYKVRVFMKPNLKWENRREELPNGRK
jgi:protein gp37